MQCHTQHTVVSRDKYARQSAWSQLTLAVDLDIGVYMQMCVVVSTASVLFLAMHRIPSI